MEQEQIDYSEIIALGFKEDFAEDKVYEKRYGYTYVIITKELTKKIHIEWFKDSRVCKMVRIDSPTRGNVKNTLLIQDLDHLKQIINFYTDK